MTRPHAPPAIEVHGLTVSYGHHAVLADLDLTVLRGVYALLGPNGAGKTTLVNALTAVLRPTRGARSASMATRSPTARRSVA